MDAHFSRLFYWEMGKREEGRGKREAGRGKRKEERGKRKEERGVLGVTFIVILNLFQDPPSIGHEKK